MATKGGVFLSVQSNLPVNGLLANLRFKSGVAYVLQEALHLPQMRVVEVTFAELGTIAWPSLRRSTPLTVSLLD